MLSPFLTRRRVRVRVSSTESHRCKHRNCHQVLYLCRSLVWYKHLHVKKNFRKQLYRVAAFWGSFPAGNIPYSEYKQDHFLMKVGTIYSRLTIIRLNQYQDSIKYSKILLHKKRKWSRSTMKAILVSADFLVFELFASFFSSLCSVTVTY